MESLFLRDKQSAAVVDPTGESIQINNDKDERERQMQALREAVGAEAARIFTSTRGRTPTARPIITLESTMVALVVMVRRLSR